MEVGLILNLKIIVGTIVMGWAFLKALMIAFAVIANYTF